MPIGWGGARLAPTGRPRANPATHRGRRHAPTLAPRPRGTAVVRAMKPPPRLLDRGRLRGYVSLPWGAVHEAIAKGRLPGPLWGLPPDHTLARWDQRAVDKALDEASGFLASGLS